MLQSKTLKEEQGQVMMGIRECGRVSMCGRHDRREATGSPTHCLGALKGLSQQEAYQPTGHPEDGHLGSLTSNVSTQGAPLLLNK